MRLALAVLALFVVAAVDRLVHSESLPALVGGLVVAAALVLFMWDIAWKGGAQ